MATITMRLPRALRDELADVAQKDYQGASLTGALRLLLLEHRVRAAYAQLRESQDLASAAETNPEAITEDACDELTCSPAS